MRSRSWKWKKKNVIIIMVDIFYHMRRRRSWSVAKILYAPPSDTQHIRHVCAFRVLRASTASDYVMCVFRSVSTNYHYCCCCCWSLCSRFYGSQLGNARWSLRPRHFMTKNTDFEQRCRKCNSSIASNNISMRQHVMQFAETELTDYIKIYDLKLQNHSTHDHRCPRWNRKDI